MKYTKINKKWRKRKKKLLVYFIQKYINLRLKGWENINKMFKVFERKESQVEVFNIKVIQKF